MKTLIIITFFLLIGAFFIISENHIQLNSSKNVDTFFAEYFNWLGELTNNGKTVTSYVTKMEWLPEP
ncbi:MAG: hypothetical protein ABIH37_05890 [archaeon]